MTPIEEKSLNHPHTIKFLYWFRYINDMLACYVGTQF